MSNSNLKETILGITEITVTAEGKEPRRETRVCEIVRLCAENGDEVSVTAAGKRYALGASRYGLVVTCVGDAEDKDLVFGEIVTDGAMWDTFNESPIMADDVILSDADQLFVADVKKKIDSIDLDGLPVYSSDFETVASDLAVTDGKRFFNIDPPKQEEKKPGFFGRFFPKKKKEEKEENKSE